MTLSAESILVGREKELTSLNGCLDSATAGRGTTVFLSGEAGSGKTRLTNEFITAARKKGVEILTGWCLSNAAIPYFPFIEAFETYISQNENANQHQVTKKLNPKAWFVSGEAEKLTQGSPQAWKDQRFNLVMQSLLALSAKKPLVLFIDDLHWADSASLSLLHYIARLIISERILVVATFRSEEIHPAIQGLTSPLSDTLQLMSREDLYQEIKLPNLNLPNTKKVAESLLGGPVHQDLVEKIFAESRGNPLFTIESLRMLSENQCLTNDSNIWKLNITQLGIPKKVRDIIIHRLNGLKPSQRRILDVASVIGDKFNPQLIGAVLNIDSLKILETLTEIALSKSLVIEEGDYYRFDHAKSREVLYENLLQPLKKGYHQRIAEKLENQTNVSHSDLAYHYTQAGQLPKSIHYTLLAGNDALQRYSNTEAINNFEYVIQTTQNIPEFSDQNEEAKEGLADAQFATGMFQEATKTYEDIFKNTAAKSEKRRLRAARKAIMSCYWLGNSKHALELAAQAKELEKTDLLEYSRLRLFAGFVLGRSCENLETAINDMNASLSVFQEQNSQPDIANALMELSFIYCLHRDHEEALSTAFRSVALQRELNDQRQLAFAIGRLGSALGTAGFFKEAIDAYAEANKIDEKVMDYNTLAFHLMMSGLYLEYIHDYTAALAQTLQALETAEKTDARYIKLLCLTSLVREYVTLGKLKLAKQRNNQLQTLFKSDPLLSSNINAVACVEMCQATLLYGDKKFAAACQIVEKLMKPKEIHTRIFYTEILKSLGKTKEAQEQTETIKKLKEEFASKFNRCNIMAYLQTNTQTTINQATVLRFDIVNVGGKPGALKQIAEILPFQANIICLPPNVAFQSNSLIFDTQQLSPLDNQVIKISITPTEPGRFTIKPKIIYTDENNKTQTTSTNPITITIAPDKKSPTTTETPRIEFKSQNSETVFQYLVKAFSDDNQRRLPPDRAGWRTLMDIVKDCKVSKHSVYNSARKHGTIISELERNKLIEAKLFTGERGRGGSVLKIRVTHEKQTATSYT